MRSVKLSYLLYLLSYLLSGRGLGLKNAGLEAIPGDINSSNRFAAEMRQNEKMLSIAIAAVDKIIIIISIWP